MSRQVKPFSWSAMPIQLSSQLSAADTAARTSSGLLFLPAQMRGDRCCSRELSIARSRSAAASFARCP